MNTAPTQPTLLRIFTRCVLLTLALVITTVRAGDVKYAWNAPVDQTGLPRPDIARYPLTYGEYGQAATQMGYVATTNDPTKNMNDDTKYTPGPWKATGESSRGTYFRVRGTRLGGKWKVCDCNYLPACVGEKEEAEANARLIAAAPELLSALHLLYACWVDEVVRNGGIRDKHHSINEVAIAAMEKATRAQAT